MDFIDFANAGSYTGPLSDEALDAGVAALEDNAARLAHDARLMLLARRHPTASMLGAMSITELARISSLFDLAARDEGKVLARAWRRLRGSDHAFPWLIFRDASFQVREDDLTRIVGSALRLVRGVDCVEPGAWASPGDVVDRSLAEALVNTAGVLCAQKIDLKAMRLWIDVVRSLPKSASDRRIFAAYRSTLVAAGLDREAARLDTLLGSVNAESGTGRPALRR